MAKHTLYIMCGPAGCGKSTFLNNCATKISEGCAIVSRDEIRFNMLKDDMSYFAKEKEVFAKFTATIASELQYADVFADSTCINEASRKKLITAVKKLNKNFDVVALYFYNDNILDRCLTQNARRSGRARVPDEAIINMCANFTIPKKSEGFKYVINVLEDDIYKRYC